MQTVEQPELVVPDAEIPDRRRYARLAGPATVYLQLAEWLLAREMNDAGDTLAAPEAAEGACQKLLDRLARLLTPSGCHALLSRALYLARSDFEFLRGIEPGLTAGAYLEGLGTRAAGTDPGQVHRGLASLLGTLMELTALFVGEYLLGRLLLEDWPDLPVPARIQPAGTDK